MLSNEIQLVKQRSPIYSIPSETTISFTISLSSNIPFLSAPHKLCPVIYPPKAFTLWKNIVEGITTFSDG